jgi:O-antigen ligase
VNLLERLVFLLFLFSIPVQLGKHFWPSFSLVQGIRVDYLSPTLYLSDIFLILLFLIYFYHLKKELKSFLLSPLTLGFLTVFLIGGALSSSFGAFLFGILKFLEFSFLGFYIAQNFKGFKKLPFLFPFILGALLEFVILFLQFLGQSSLGGFFYFLGERTFSVSTLGIAVFKLQNTLILRPYGTFPHPNVLAYYLFFTFVLTLFWLDVEKIKEVFFKTSFLIILGIGIFLTFSRVIVLEMIAVLIFWVFLNNKNFKYKKTILILLSFAVPLLFLAFWGRLFSDFYKDIFLRFNLLRISVFIFRDNPIFGVGLNNFYFEEAFYQKTVTPTLLQPVHNIYFLFLSETGIAGLLLLLLFLKKTLLQITEKIKEKKYSKNLSTALFVLFLATLFIGLFDHYPLTLQQGQLITAILLGIIYSKT